MLMTVVSLKMTRAGEGQECYLAGLLCDIGTLARAGLSDLLRLARTAGRLRGYERHQTARASFLLWCSDRLMIQLA